MVTGEKLNYKNKKKKFKDTKRNNNKKDNIHVVKPMQQKDKYKIFAIYSLHKDYIHIPY